MTQRKTKTAQENNPEQMSPLYRFFCWCSGARLYLLKKCPSDYNKFFGIGVIVFLTGIMASISGAYALYTVFESFRISLAFGVLWGILIFFLDWYLVASLKKEDKLLRELSFAFPRLLLSVFLAVIISKPLELKLFEKEINRAIVSLQRENSIRYNTLLEEEFEQIDRLKEENQALKAEIDQKEQQRNSLFQMIISEAEGTSGTGIAGKGPVYREKKQQFDKIDRELQTLREQNSRRIKENNTQIDRLNKQKNKQLEQGYTSAANYNGFLARLEGMSYLSEKKPAVKFASWFIIFLFITIESAPVLVKIMSRRGPYDQLLDLEEYTVHVETEKQTFDINTEANRYIDQVVDQNEMKADAELRTNQEFIAKLTVAQNEVNQKRLEKWKEKALNKANNDDDDLKFNFFQS